VRLVVSRLLLAAPMSRTLRVLVFSSSLFLTVAALGAAHAQPAPIVGGTQVPAGKWNDVVAVIGHHGTCSGTLIAPDVVLTAGHCVDIEPYQVITNTTDFSRPAGDHIAVKWARAYPDWASRYDIAVLMLEHVARPRPRPIASACHTNDRLRAGAPLTVVGFGLTTPSGLDDNTRLHEASIPVLDPFCTSAPGCEAAVRPNGEFTAGGRGTDSCFGDSGGPAFLDGPAGPALVGVVSRGLAIPGAPCGNGGIYVRADKVVAWAQRVTERRFTRTTCDGERDERGDAPGELTDDTGGADDAGGCSSTRPPPITFGLGLAIAISVLRRRRRTGTGTEGGSNPAVSAAIEVPVLSARACPVASTVVPEPRGSQTMRRPDIAPGTDAARQT